MEELNITLKQVANSLKDVADGMNTNQSFWYMYKDLIIFSLGLLSSATFNFIKNRKTLFENQKTELRQSLNTLRQSRIENVSIISKNCQSSISSRLLYGAPAALEYDQALKSLYYYRHDKENFEIAFSYLKKNNSIFYKKEMKKIESAYNDLIKHLNSDYEMLFLSIEEHFIKFNQIDIQIKPFFHESDELTSYSKSLIKLLQ